MSELRADPLALLRTRTSAKWTAYPADVLPMFVAEMDYPVAPEIAARLVELVGRSDLGYESRRPDLGLAFAAFADDAWDWRFEPGRLKTTTNVVVALTELLRAGIEPGDRVVVNSPVYYPFYGLIAEAGGVVQDVPLLSDDADDWRLDLDGLAQAFADGARAYMLCHPHNPIGFTHDRETLARIAELAAEHDVLVLSDEIHGPLTHSDAEFVPYLSVSDPARATGIAVSSASKAFNLPGLSTAFWVPGGPEVDRRIASLPESVQHRSSHFGVHAATVAFNDARGWLADVVETIELQRRRLRELLTAEVPEAILHEPRASYLAWIDFRGLGWGDDPAKRILKEARVALNSGPTFGAQTGRGFARLNFACSPEVLAEGVTRIAALR